MDTKGSFPGGVEGDWLGHEANHSPPSFTRVKKKWSYISAPPYVFIMSTGTWTLS